MSLASVSEQHLQDDAIKVIHNTSEKFRLYMAHVCRCTCQSQYLSFIDQGLKRECMFTKGKKTKALMIIDFKMKFETMSVRESTLEHFGKRGIGWHGCAIIYYLYKVKTDDKNNIEYDTNGSEIYEPRKNIVYIDQILESSNKQDGMMVISLLEAALVAINDQLPFIDEIILQSDNAMSYQNPQVLFGVHLLNVKYQNNIYVGEFTHSETQDGKTLLDAHFASMNKHLLSFMKMYKKNTTTRIQTPSGLASALSFRSGLRNTMVQLVECDRDVMEEWVSIIEPTAKKARDYFSRANHVFYERTNNSNIGINFQDIIKHTFMIKLQSFSGVDRPVAFHVNISNKSFQPSEDAQNEINAFMKGDRSQPPPTNVEANLKATKRNDIVNEDKDKAVDDFVFENNHKYSTRGHKHESTVNYNDTSSDDSSDDESYSTDSLEESDDDKYDSDTNTAN